MKQVRSIRSLVLIVFLAVLMAIANTGFVGASYADNRQVNSFGFVEIDEVFIFHESVSYDRANCHQDEAITENVITRAAFPVCQKAGCPSSSVNDWTVVSTSSVPITPFYESCGSSCPNPHKTPNHIHYVTGTRTTTVYRCRNCSSTYTHIHTLFNKTCYIP